MYYSCSFVLVFATVRVLKNFDNEPCESFDTDTLQADGYILSYGGSIQQS